MNFPDGRPIARVAARLRCVSGAWAFRIGGLLLAVSLAPASADPLSMDARARIARHEPTRVIVEFNVRDLDAPITAERVQRGLHVDDRRTITRRAAAYQARKAWVRGTVSETGVDDVRDLPQLPLAIWTLSSPEALAGLESSAGVRVVHENRLLHRASIADLPLIRAPQASAAGFTGTGETIAVIDGGLVATYGTYPDFGSCNGTTLGGACRVVVNQIFYPGKSSETTHGTNVSAIALGVATGARLAMFNVFNGGSAQAADIITALDGVLADRSGANQFNYVAVNLSLGDGTSHATQCADSVYAAAITSLSNAGIATVAAAGNSGSKTGLSDPACVPGVISVGAVYDRNYGGTGYGFCSDSAPVADLVTCFSQSASYLSLLAPGTFVDAPDASFEQTGTSQATPHVAGAIAALRSRYPSEPLAELLQRLQSTGVTDTDPANGRPTPRIDLYAAGVLGTALTITGSGPTKGVAGQSGLYTVKISNGGPLGATNVRVQFRLPASASLTAAPTGCTLAGSVVTCTVGTLAVGASQTLQYSVRYNTSGATYAHASSTADEFNAAPGAQQSLGFGDVPVGPAAGDGPLPPWSYALLAAMLAMLGARSLRSRDIA